MSTQDNIKTVQAGYAAFGSGDIDGLLKLMSPDVDWQGIVGAGTHVAGHGKRRGPAQVGKFFQEIGASVNFQQFEPREFLADGDKVVALGHYSGTVTPTGRGFDEDFVMVFTVQ